MQTVEKKQHRRPSRGTNLLFLLLALMALAGILVLTHVLEQPQQPLVPSTSNTVRTLFHYPADAVRAIHISRQGEAPWAVQLDPESGCFVLQGEEGFALSETVTAELQQAACSITCEAIVSSDPAEYAPHLAEYGLDAPSRTAVITFADGASRTLRIGSRAAHTAAWYYMTIDGDDNLYALSTGMVEDLFVSQESLHDVTQPVIHKARIDRISLRNADGSLHAEWTLMGDIAEDDAAERWQITAPFIYPADSAAMSSLLANAANLRLGAYISPATEDALTEYGFLAPRMTIEIHMAEGAIGTTDMDGAFTTTDYPESSVSFTIGGARSDMVDYVLFEGNIFISSHFTMGVFMDADPQSTMNRYPVLTALGNLSSLSIEENGTVTTYVLTRTEQVAPNNDLVYDEEGNVVWAVTVTRNGESFDYAAFEAAYMHLVGVSVAGVIPDGDTVNAAPHTIYTFTDVDGTVHTIALHSYGVLHDAVSIDGHQAFYIAKNTFRLELE